VNTIMNLQFHKCRDLLSQLNKDVTSQHKIEALNIFLNVTHKSSVMDGGGYPVLTYYFTMATVTNIPLC